MATASGGPAPTPPPVCRLLAGASTSGSPHLRPISNQFQVGLAWWEWVCLQVGGQPQVGELGVSIGMGSAACLRLEAQQQAWGTLGVARPGSQGPHVKHTVPSRLLALHHWGTQTLV